MTNGTIVSYRKTWEDGDRGGKLINNVVEVIITTTAAVLTVVPADFGWTYFALPSILYGPAGVAVQWTITKDAAGNITSMVTASAPGAGNSFVTLRGI